MTRQQFERDWQFHGAVYERLRAKAERNTDGEWDLDRWEGVLTRAEFDTLLVLNFVYAWENNGRFVDTVSWHKDRFDLVTRAFRRLGFDTASGLMQRALELDAIQASYLEHDRPLPVEIGDEIHRIEEAASADVSEDRLTAAIVSRRDEFGV